MAILWDAPLTAAAAAALARRLGPPADGGKGARLRALLLDYDARSLLLWFREATLVLRLHPDDGALLLLDPADPPNGARPLSALVEAVEAPPDDRVLLLSVRKLRGDRAPYTVAVEWMSNQWNAVVTEGPDRRIRHVLRPGAPGGRSLTVGSAYELPPPSGREGREGEVTLDRWRALLGGVAPENRRGVLLSSVAWTSSVNVDAILGDAAGADVPDAGDVLEAAWTRWRDVALVASGERAPEPVLLHTPRGSQPYPLPLHALECEEVGDVLEALALADRGGGGTVARIPSAWVRSLEQRLHAARGKIRGLERELEEAPDPDDVRSLGDLILARYRDVPSGASRAVLQDFESRPVEVELDPALPPEKNAERYYREAGRAERALARLPTLVDQARADAQRLEELLERIASGDAEPDEVSEALPSLGRREANVAEEPSLPYRRYRSSGGLEIRVGRGARRNDDLTFRHSRPDDVWLHARHASGAHVILRWDAADHPPARDLYEAGVLAAVHSKARTSGSVPVDWTRRKYVRSPRKAPPGTVIPDRVQTVFVEPDEELEKRLRES
jgi:hypothetical protein